MTCTAHIAAIRGLIRRHATFIWMMISFCAGLENIVTKIGKTMIVFRFNGLHIRRAIQAIVATIGRDIGSLLTIAGVR